MDPVVKIIYKMNNTKCKMKKRIYHLVLRIVYSCDIMPDLKIGCNCKFAHRGLGVIINSNSIIGDYVKIGANVCIGGRSGLQPPIVEDNVEIGVGALILGPITIGRFSQIGAGSVVVKDIPPFSIVVGNPAKVIKTLNQEDFK